MKLTAYKRRALSPLIATIILIAITLVGGVVVYRVFFSTSTTSGQVETVSVAGELIQPAGAANAVLTLTITNTGTVPITSMSVTFGGTTATVTSVSSTSPLQPGQSASYTPSTAPSACTIGNTYPVVVSGSGPSGSFSQALTLVCSSA